MNFFRKICFVATLLLLAMPMVAATIDGGGKIEKKVWQDSDPNKENYFNNRRALVGPGCMINSIGDGVQVVSGTANLQNLCNDDMDDYATIPALVGATVVASPIISVKDKQHYYAGGTEAGFVICAKSNASILTLDLAKFYKIQFLKDGEKVGDLQPISTGKSVTGLGLSLLTFPGSDQVNKLYMATAPGNFDEIKLVQCGVDANVLSAINIKYAFVGKAREYTVTNNKENGIAKYAQEQKRGTFTLSTSKLGGNMIDENLTNGYAAVVGVLVPVSTPVTVYAKPSDNEESFPKGTEVGFKFNGFNLANLSVGSGIELTLFNKENKEIGKYDISNKLLGLGLIEDTKDGEVVMRAPAAFSAAKIYFKGIGLTVGGTSVNYAFVRMAPDAASHHCPIKATASGDVCGCDNSLTLQHNNDVHVTWTIEHQPEGSSVKLNSETGDVSDIFIPGKYVFKATADDGCFETATLNYAQVYDPEENGVKMLINKDGEPRKYKLSDKFGGSLLQIFDGMQSRSAVLTPTLNDFAYRTPGVSLAANQGLVGIKTADGKKLGEGFTGDMEVGFVVTTKATGLSADVLSLYNIKLFNEGEEVTAHVTTHWNAVSAGLIGSEDVRKLRLSIDVPQGCVFDEVVLYKSGVLAVDLSQLNVYYAYVCDANAKNATTDMLFGAQVVSDETTNASIDFANTKLFAVASVGSGYNNLSNLVDNDPNFETGYALPFGLEAVNVAKISVNIGKTVTLGQQLVMITSQLNALTVNLADGLKLATYLNGEFQEDLTNWKVLNADVIGAKGNGYVILKATKPFDQVRLTTVGGVELLKGMAIKGFALRSNMNDDGTLDGCEDLLVLDEDYTLKKDKDYSNAKMLFHRTFAKNEDAKKGWNSLILPVDMTANQVAEAFGEGTQIAKFDRLEDKWIYFKPINVENSTDVMLLKNTPYIIYPTKEPFGNYTYTIDGKTQVLNGPVYVATGINFDKAESAQLLHQDNGENGALTDMVHYGSYENGVVVPTGAYMLAKNDMVHTAKVHNVKAYRCWLKETTPSGKTLELKVASTGSKPTAIKVVEEHNPSANTSVYSVSGVRMNSNDTNKLPAGVYIMNNRKIIVK